jgi:hypothetical protein
VSPLSTLARLQRWYKSNCDGEREHGNGITIETIDNPGWSIEICLDRTPLASVPFQRVERGEEDDNYDDSGKQIRPWWVCRVAELVGTYPDDGEQYSRGLYWDAYCDPDSLEQVLTVFLDWAEANTPPTPNLMP